MNGYPKELIDDIVDYHFKNREHIFAEMLIKKNLKFAEALKLELDMQLMFEDKHTMSILEENYGYSKDDS